ncbi:tail length tape measure protein [Vibrio phage vB_VspP_pVa5]|uniref:Tape measure protein n=1 Tax=Vibrio phage vB_VspP_pVa5 TaxID=1913109 RepID=A0A1J0GV27_9CAUD|nr:tail length tape measure protein [Vibrio phage vB_VspP_pVa5]APC46034.1 tape measure protein [Vibrio phage vB_VspP_pVa5]
MSELNEGLEPSSAVEQDDFLSMSDDDILNMPFPEAEVHDEAPAEELEPEAEEDELELDTEEEFEDEEEVDEPDVFGEADTETEDEPEVEQEEEDTNEVEESSDYKSKYDELMSPLRANGKDVEIKTPDDLRRLAQMGIGYNARMAEIKPLRKIGKMLENAGLLEESKINFLIDLSKNNPDAINKLVHQSGINPLDIEPENSDGYKPNTYTVDDSQLDLDEALTNLEQSPSGQKVIDVVSTKWDRASREILVSNPSMMQGLQAHMDNGIYDQVVAEVERERMFNRIPAGVSDLDAYNHIGNQMNAAGVFNKQPAAPSSPKPNVAAKPKDTKRKTRRKAAASTRSKATSTQVPQDILNMSDADFEKNLMSKYI